MQPKFPGMNPYLENPELWSEVHFGMIAVLARSLNAVITPKYRAAVEKRVYADSLLVGIPDVSVFQRGTEAAEQRAGEGKVKYDAKRQTVLNSTAHLVEIDVLRTGKPKPMAGGVASDYRILVSRANRRPAAELYPFNLREALPRFLLPLCAGDQEPVVDLHSILEQVHKEAALNLAINYTQPPIPPISNDDFA